MKNKKIIKILSVIFIITGIIIYSIYWAFFDIQRIKGQDILEISQSENQKYTVTAFLNNGGDTVDYAVLCQVKDNETNKAKNIYWQYHCETANIKWIDDETVSINGVILNVATDIYDYRRMH